MNSGVEALTHYLHFGWKERRRPCPLFDPEWYLAEYPDVEEANLEPLAHYLGYGSLRIECRIVYFDPIGIGLNTLRLR